MTLEEGLRTLLEARCVISKSSTYERTEYEHKIQ